MSEIKAHELEAIRDFQLKVTAQLLIWQFEDKKYGLKHIKEIKEDAELYSWCEEVVALYRRSITEEVKESEYNELYEKIDRARAWAWAGAEEEYYLALRDEFLSLIKNAPMKK